MQFDLEQKVDELLTRGVVDVIEKDHLRNKLLSGKILRIKFGIDPTGPNIHIGRGSTIKKLKEFQKLGHKIVLIIGDGTGRVGDSSDKTEGRRMLSDEEISKNKKNYLEQIGKIIDLEKTEIHHNSEWIDKLTPAKWIELASLFTIQQMTERDNFANRIKSGNPIGYQEGMYSMLQGFDSVAIKSDVEIGGTDQLFNLLAGRKIQKYFDQEPQDILTLQLLAGTDGRKMSTTWGNVILINDAPDEKFGKIMRIADSLISTYLECATEIPMSRINEINKSLEKESTNPMEYKKELAYELVKFYDGEDAAKNAKLFFEHTVQNKEAPEIIPIATTSSEHLDINEIISHLVTSNIVKSKSEGKRLLSSGAISIEEKKLSDDSSLVVNIPKDGVIIKAGKRKYLKILRT
jgi:tyrosyl-tRNA synthetase